MIKGLRAVFGKKSFVFLKILFLHSRIKSDNLLFDKKGFFHFFTLNLTFFNKLLCEAVIAFTFHLIFLKSES